MLKRITPRTLKGFRDSLPYGAQGEQRRRQVAAALARLFALAGFDPIDTPALEYSEVLLGKAGGETEKQVYRFRDQGGRDVALRFDLTVPFARFVAQHGDKLCFPFKRYHIAKVWRGENAQHGRYREFYQCDFDIVGDSSALSDLAILQLVQQSLGQLQGDFPALAVGKPQLRVNHRALLAAFWQLCGVAAERRAAALRMVDKRHKVSSQTLWAELEPLLGQQTAKLLCEYLGLQGPQQPDFSAAVARIEELLLRLCGTAKLCGTAAAALAQLRHIAAFAQQDTVPLYFDPSIVRGLDYYTGMVFETFLEGLPSLGSICSGGRYDQLTQLYRTAPMPGVGGSIGLDRLLAGLEQMEGKAGQPARSNEPQLIMSLEPDWDGTPAEHGQAELACLRLSAQLQGQGIACDLVASPSVQTAKAMKALFARAERRGCRYLLLRANSHWQLRDLQQRENRLFGTDSKDGGNDEVLQALQRLYP